MKKFFALILTLVITFGMTACGGSTKDIQPTDAAEPTAEPTPAPEVEYSDKWEIDYAVDDFGDPTEQVYIRSMPISGKFSNTATTDSDLTAVLFFEPYFTNPSNYTLNSKGNIETIDGNARSCLSFRLLEYGKQKATYLDSEDMVLKFKIGDDSFSTNLYGNAPNDDLFFGFLEGGYKDEDQMMIRWINALRFGKEVKCVIEIGSSKYSFSIDGEGFIEAYYDLQRQCGITPK